MLRLPWSNNYTDQLYAWDQLKIELMNKDAELRNSTRQTVILEGGNAPSISQWEAAWVEQTGYPLPIPTSAELIHVINNNVVTLYRILPDGTLVENSPNTPKKGVYLLRATNFPTGVSTTSNFFTTPSIPLGNISIDRYSWIELGISAYFNVVTAPVPTSSVFAIDFYANSAKLSTLYFNTSVSAPYMFLGRESAYINVWMLIPNFAPGTYTLSCGIGNTGNPTTPGTWNLSPNANTYVKGYKL